MIADAIDRAVTPAAVVEVGRAAGPIWRETVRTPHATTPTRRRPRLDTIFDLASLTKVMATTSLVMRGVAEASAQPRHQASVRSSRAGVTPSALEIRVRHLLEHSAGFPAHLRLWESASGRTAYEAALRAVPLERPPGAASVYSDIGFMVLGFVLEAARGRAARRAVRRASPGVERDDDLQAVARARSRVSLPRSTTRGATRGPRRSARRERARARWCRRTRGTLRNRRRRRRLRQARVADVSRADGLGTPSLMRTFAAQCQVPSSSRALGWDTMRPTSSCGALMSARRDRTHGLYRHVAVD